jgi:hypothetical protein
VLGHGGAEVGVDAVHRGDDPFLEVALARGRAGSRSSNAKQGCTVPSADSRRARQKEVVTAARSGSLYSACSTSSG